MTGKILTTIKNVFGGDIDIHPTKLTIVQSVVVTVLASSLAIGSFYAIGVHYHTVWYHLFASLGIASILAPIFLYPTFRTSGRLRQANAIIEKQATTDHLTNLPNMFALTKELEGALRKVQETSCFALHFIDLDRFKQINDSLGHDAGNALLVEAANRLRAWIGSSGFVARYGGDEFIVLQYSVSDEACASSFATEMARAISTSYFLYDQEVSVGATVGSAMAPLHGRRQEQLLKAADMAVYEAKAAGLVHRMFDPALASRALKRRRIESVLGSAVRKQLLRPYFHSIVQLRNPLRIVGFEALARIELPTGEVLLPDDFIPVAESTGMILELGEYMLKQACRECARWRPELFVAVNVSPYQFLRGDFVETVVEALDESGLPAHRLELEITESVLIDDIEEIRPALVRLREMGVRIALDDFGSGFCGLHYLRRVAIDKIKVDKSIVDDADSVTIAGNILRSVSNIAREMGLTVTAEGVDSLAKAEFLAREHCVHELQGYLFSRPATADGAYRMQQFLGHARPDAKIVALHGHLR